MSEPYSCRRTISTRLPNQPMLKMLKMLRRLGLSNQKHLESASSTVQCRDTLRAKFEPVGSCPLFSAKWPNDIYHSYISSAMMIHIVPLAEAESKLWQEPCLSACHQRCKESVVGSFHVCDFEGNESAHVCMCIRPIQTRSKFSSNTLQTQSKHPDGGHLQDGRTRRGGRSTGAHGSRWL